MRAFEIFLTEDKVTASDWHQLVEKVKEYEKNFVIEVTFTANQVEFFLYAKKDLSLLATKLDAFLLKPAERRSLLEGEGFLQKTSFKLPSSKNILEIKEKEEIKKGRSITRLVVKFLGFFNLQLNLVKVFLKDERGKEFYSSYFTFHNPLLSFEFDFSKRIKFKKKSPPTFLNIEELSSLFTPNRNKGFLQVFGFPYFSHKIYFSLRNFEFDKHSLIIGQTGVGKSKLIELFVKEIPRSKLEEEYRLVVIDPHAVLYPQFLELQSKINFDFVHTSCELFPAFSEPKIATELTILLFKTLLEDQFSAKMERVLKYVIYILFLTNQMSLFNLKRFLTELECRKEVLKQLEGDSDYLVHFFETEFVEIQTKFYEIAIMPILVLIDELNFIPAFSKESSYQLESVLQENFLTSFSLNRIFLGDKATRLIAGLLIEQIFLIAQRRSLNEKIILLVDEVSLIENESLITILSEARKFNLSLFLSQQYLTQITPELLKGVLSNVYNYFTFKVSDEDAKILAKNLEVKFPDEILKKAKEKGISEDDLKRNLLVTLNPRECLARIFSQGKFYPCFKAKTLTV